jgi:phage terminase large subunit-like protein
MLDLVCWMVVVLLLASFWIIIRAIERWEKRHDEWAWYDENAPIVA